MTSFDVLEARVGDMPIEIVSKNGRVQNHELKTGRIADFGEFGLQWSVRLPEGLQGEYELVLRLKIGS